MKRFILLLLILTLTGPLFAQLEVKPYSFKEVPGFVNINPDENYQTDDNNLPFAVIKVRTENINDKQRRELKFSGNAGTFIMLEYKDGEVWVYLTAQYADYLKITHPDLSSFEFTLPFDLKPKCGYEMTLVNKSESISNGWASLTITTSPENCAEITLNGRTLNQTTPYTNNMIPAGKYEITVSKFGFANVTKTIVINEGESTDIVIEMPYKYGKVSVVSNPTEAIVLIDDIVYGKTPLIIDTIKYGIHEIKVKKTNWESYSKQFKITSNDTLTFDVVLDKYPDGAITGVFSVSPTKKVYFSKGNLQYQASTNTWRFAENQYDIIGDANEKYLRKPRQGWIDLFGWGTSGYNDKHPNTTGSNYTQYGNGDEDISNSYYDWGEYNTISNSNNHNWRTLTKDEWDYIFNKRNTNSSIRYAKAIVNGIKGVILLPDNWNSAIYNLTNTSKHDSNFVEDIKFDSNIISRSDWHTILEINGAVFLPAGGHRLNGSLNVGDANISGSYWSSTNASYGDGAYHVSCTEYYIGTAAWSSRSEGCSVRLVCDVE